MAEITSVCRQCGLAANALTCLVKYGDLPKQPSFLTSTFHRGICDCCQRDTNITEVRDFFYPNFKLIHKGAWQKALGDQKRTNNSSIKSIDTYA